MTATEAPLLELENIRKEYGNTVALDSIDLTLFPGRVHGLVGENGAGKSTLVKILSGAVRPDSGRIIYQGKEASMPSPPAARALGISTVFQELSLIPDLSVAENIQLQNAKAWTGSRKERARRGSDIARQWGLESVDMSTRVSNLSLRDKQLVEILSAVNRPHEVLILDEPTSALLPDDTVWLQATVSKLTSRGSAVIFISHMLDEVEQFCHEVSVQRNGQIVSSVPMKGFVRTKAIEQMIGRSLEFAYPNKPVLPADAPVRLEATGVQVRNAVRGVDFSIRAGEILGVAGLDGQGQSELFAALAGDLPMKGGEVKLRGKKLKLKSPRHAFRSGGEAGGISLVPAERKTHGVILDMSVRKNIGLPALASMSKLGIVSEKRESSRVKELMDAVQVLANKIDDPVRSLSGGNQQKVVFAKAIVNDVQVVLLFDPTRGVDVGTKHELYKLIGKLAEAGKSILLYSTEIPELTNLCHRVIVCYEGRIVDEKSGAELTETNLMAAAIGMEGTASHADD